MKLYPYQLKIFEIAIKTLRSSNRAMVVVPTGGGKTVIFSHLAKELGLRTLIVAHTKELISQCTKTFRKVGYFNFEAKSVQWASRNLYNLARFDFLIVDECHRSCAESYVSIIRRFNGKKILGVTATPFRSDGKDLGDLFGERISPLSILDMIEAGLLCDLTGYRLKTNISLTGVSTKAGDFVAAKLSSVVNVANRNDLIVEGYKKISYGERCLCFAVNIEHSDELAKTFRESGIEARSIHGRIPNSKRQDYIKRFSSGEIKVLVNCQILTEGFDETSIACILMARPTCSKVLYTQMIGRGTRLHPGKNVCKVIEFTDNDYDVANMESLASESNTKLEIRFGERFSEFCKRKKQHLQEVGSETIVEEIRIIKKSYLQRNASEWQISFLKSHDISFKEPLSEFEANNLICRIYGRN